LISSSGALLLLEVVRVAGLGRALSAALSPWRAVGATHDPGKVLLDVATAVALGGDCLADVAAVRSQPELFGSVASDRTVSRVFAALAGDVEDAVAAIRQARAQARAAAWSHRRPLAGRPGRRGGRRAGGQVIVDIDAKAACSELVFSDVLWPDVDRRHLSAAIEAYAARNRRYGRA
jgi:hypothetical protein